MQIIDFSQSIRDNIERTYTFAYVKNAFSYEGKPETYDAEKFFLMYLEDEPFDAFLALDGFAFKRTKQTLDRYGIRYTQDQERRAKVYQDVTERMQKERSDFISMYVENFDKTGIVLYKDPYVITTETTIKAHEAMDRLPVKQKTTLTIYKHRINPMLKASREQMNAVRVCIENKISCLIGGAGTGKSFVTATIIDQLLANGKKVVILAPTHKARESLQKKIDKGTVRTIHSFVHNPDPCDAIVIDESGMLSTPLFKKLMDNWTGQHLVFVGDKNQLPPIEYGRPFERLQKECVVAELKDNKRSEAPEIVALGREILGEPQNANMNHDHIEVVSTIDEAFNRGAEVLLTFTNNDVKETNQSQRVKNGKPAIHPDFSIGDKIIAKTNDKNRFFNGQLFEIIDFDVIQKIDNGEYVTLKSDKDLLFNFDLAYGLTIHKSQGSEWDVVAYKPSDKDTTNLAYVAVTRAKKHLIIVGEGLKNEYLPEKAWRQLNEINRI
ncbi:MULTISPECIES: AAA family ATPase [unclassified Facklamia]|uniref:ATP-dependent DNA helicase n=1 Tax=Aerococcaceae TaxID=186827 RepID=UPI0013BBA3EF|nr:MULTISPECIES: AAA family ATPase [unclassified Facklamia]MBS4462898.1 AAA family ATPase [Aerococcaceae bacterium zg-B36]NEW65296.1 AAA family ATPase [Facklamia sp. 252]NEW68804.1 AAA family ATPase [Facklamia sp. 253]QQD66115.1 AAA family ATPase [Aerococcaceae bacterium zg-252]